MELNTIQFDIETKIFTSNIDLSFQDDNIEYFKNKIIDLYYATIRTNVNHELNKTANKYGELLCSLKSYKNLLQILYKLIAQTRDICYGKGERDITYIMIYQWWKYYPQLGLSALYAMMFYETGCDTNVIFKTYIDLGNKYVPHKNSYGCFKDVKYFCNYVLNYGDKSHANNNNILCKYAITILNQRVYDDYKEYLTNGTMPSLACKWVPRENSKYDWIFEKMAIQWIQATDPIILSSINIEQYENTPNISFKNCKAIIKCKTIYRKVISLLCKQLDLPETKQCNKKWSEINPATITLDAMFRNNNALFNIDNTFDNRKRTITDIDRRKCAHNIKEHAFMSEMSPQFKMDRIRKNYINQHTFSPLQFVKQAIKLIGSKNGSIEIQQNILYQIGLLNNNWRKFSQKCNALDFFIPIVDMSLSMREDALYNAIGMSCLIAEKSKIGQRIMVMDSIPTWVNLEGCCNFVEMVEMLYNYTNRNTIANILKTFDIIIDAITRSNSVGGLSGENKKMELVFILFTNESSYIAYENEMIHTHIINRFASAKLDIPHIIYWNCSHTTNIDLNKPVYGLTNKSAIVSGTNAELLNHFMFIGWSKLYENNSFDTIQNILDNSRYDMMGDLFDKYFPCDEAIGGK